MRDPKRINEYLNRLGAIWADCPDWRFGQLLINLLGAVREEVGMDLFFVEDKEFFDALEKCYNRIMGRNNE